MAKKLVSSILALSLALVMLIGTTATAAELKVTFWDGNWNEETFSQIKELWNEQYPDIELSGEFMIDQGMFDKYMLSMQNGTGPDVAACALDWVTTLGNAGLLAPLDDYIAADGVDTAEYVQGAINASTINGNLYGLPFRSETYVLYYNVDILKAAGFDKAPETWDEVVEIAKAINSEEVAGYGLVGANYGNFSFQFITMLRSSGGSILTEDLTQSALNSEAALATAKLYRELANYAPASLLENDNVANRTLFASGKVAMYMSGIYDLPQILATNPDLNFACAMVPTAMGAQRKSILGGWSVAIPATSQNKDAAWKFVKFLTSSEVAALYTNTFTGTGVPAKRFEAVDTAIVQPNIDALPYAAALPAVGAIVPIRQAIFDNLSLCLTDTLTPEEAIMQTSEVVDELLSE